MKCTETEIYTNDKVSLYFRDCGPNQDAKAIVCLVHGLGEHSQRYQPMAQFLSDHSYRMLAYDLRGHGKSGGQRGYIPSYDALLDDIAIVLLETVQRYPGKPVFLYGHSLGGGLVINYALRRRPKLAGVIATGPALRLGFEPPAVKVVLGKLMNQIYPAFSQASGLDVQALARDPEVVRRYQNDPLVHDKVSARLFMGFYQAGLWAIKHADEFPLPLLLMHGSLDRLTSPQASQDFAARVGDQCTLKIWDGFYHEIHNEPEQAQVFQYLLGWMETKFA